MMKKMFQKIFFLLFFFSFVVFGQNRRETRAVWVVTNFHLDWPTLRENLTEQKIALDNIFRTIRNKNFNTVYFQSIIKGSALYKSSLLPFVPYFSKDNEDSVSFDPLDYAILLARKYGLEIHAWVNVGRVFSGDELEFLNNPKHLINIHPDWVKKIRRFGETSFWLNFGNPEARKFMIDVLCELTRNYAVDGIQLDFIRYPGHKFPDTPEFIAFGDTLNRDDWRRENVNLFVSALHDSLKAINPLLKIGATPFGIYKNLPDAEGSEAFYTVYQDSRKWLKKGWVDYLTPQIYWDIDHNPRFDSLAADWVRNSFGRNIVIGTAPYKRNVYNQLDKMISFTRKVGASGIAFFRYGFIKNRYFPEFKNFVFPAKMPWLDSHKPLAPLNFIAVADSTSNKITLSWEKSLSENIKYFSLYSVDSSSEYEDKKLISLFPKGTNFVGYTIEHPSKVKYNYELCAVNKLWNESKPSKKKPSVVLTRLNKLIEKRNLIPLKPILVKRESKYTLCYYANNESSFKIKVIHSGKENIKIVRLKKGINYVDIPTAPDFNLIEIINPKSKEKITLKNLK